MAGFADTYLGRLRARIGHDLVLMPGAQVAVMDETGAVLVQRRTDDGYWELPSGACEPGQTFAQCAVAELQEEAGVLVREEDLIPFASASDQRAQRLTYPNGDMVQAYALCFLVRVRRVEVAVGTAADGEATGHHWAVLDDLPTPMSPSCTLVVERLRAYLRTGAFIAG